MGVMILLVPLALGMGFLFVGLFLWGLRSGQNEDLESPRHRMLIESDE